MAGLAVVGTVPALKGAISMILIYCFWYNVTIGATAYTILCETSTSRLRIKTIAIGFALQNALNTMWSFVLPYLFNPDQLNLGGKLGFIFGGSIHHLPGISLVLPARDGWPDVRGVGRNVCE
jgi:hypothetical protein